MLADATFWSSATFQIVAAVLAGLAVFLIAWFLFGTAARAKQDKVIAARMRSMGQRVKQQDRPAEERTLGGWVPESVTSFGQRFADRQGFSERMDAQLEAAGLSLRSGEFVVVTAGAGLLGVVLGLALFKSLLLALVVGAVCSVAPRFFLKTSLGRRADKLREQLPDVLTILASSLRAGHSFMQALDTVAKEIAPPAAAEFQRVVAEVRLGRPTEEALASLADRVGSGDFKWAVLAVNIQREVGGNLAEILDNVADTLRERAMLRRQIRVLTSEGRLSAWVLGFMPFGLALYMLAVNREYISLLYTTHIGLVMVGVAGVLLTLGILWMRKIVDIDV